MLTPEEQAELQALEQDALEQQMPGISNQINPLSLDEQQELALLEQELNPLVEPSFGQKAMGALQTVGEAVDKYGGGASTRSAIGALQKGEGFGGAVSAFGQQYGEDPSLAPTGEQIAAQAGASTMPTQIEPASGIFGSGLGNMPEGIGPKGPSAADIAGFAIDMLADPLALLPFGSIAKGGKVVAKGGTKMAMKGSKALADATKVTDAVSLVSDISRSAKSNLKKLFKPTLADDAADLVNIAKKNNIDVKLLPESVEFGQMSPISRKARAITEGPMGADRMERFEKFTEGVNKAYDENITKLSPNSRTMGHAESGRVLKDGYQKAVKNFFGQMDDTYSGIVKKYPDAMINDKAMESVIDRLGKIENFAGSRMRFAVTPEQARQAKGIIRAIKGIKKTDGSLNQMRGSLKMVGEALNKPLKSGETIPLDVKKFHEIYDILQDAIIQTIKKDIDPIMAEKLISNNKAMSKFIGKTSDINKIIKNPKIPDEKVFKSLILSGDTKKLEALKSVLDEDTWNAMKSSFLEGITKRNADGNVMYKSTINSLKKANNRDVLKIMLDEGELNEFTEILRLGDRGGIPTLSTSGTGASNQFANMLNTIKNFAIDEVALQKAITGARNRTEKAALQAVKAAQPEKAVDIIQKLPRTKRSKFLKVLKAMQVKSVGKNGNDKQ